MVHVDVVGVLLRTTGCIGQGWTRYLTYIEYTVIFLFFVGAYPTVVRRTYDNPSTTDAGSFSVQLYGILCMFIVAYQLLGLPIRMYYRSDFRDMYRYGETVGIPDDYRSAIVKIAVCHVIASNMFVTGSAWVAVVFDSVRAGDPFSFPFADVLPVPATNLAVYACKYVVYMLPLYIAHYEVCFQNTTFVHAAGALKRHFEIVGELVEEAIAHGDERKLKNAIKQHQDVLNHFEIMKTMFAKPILYKMAFCAVYYGFSICVIIEAIKGNIHQIILGISISSGTVSLATAAIYCTYASRICDLHDELLCKFMDHRLYFLDKSFKKLSLIMMSRVNIPLEFQIGYIYTINLEQLVRILKFSYTVLNVLLAALRLKNITG